jgi:hypothetical protein
MKTLKLLTLLLLAAVSGAFAGDGSPEILGGLKAGLNFYRHDADAWTNQFNSTLQGGAFVAVNTHRIGGQLELIYQQTTYQTSSSFYDAYHQYYNDLKDSLKSGAFRVNYLNIPILLNIKFTNMVWLQLGPQFSGKLAVKDVDNLLKSDERSNFFKGAAVSGVGGLWLQLPFRINAGVRYVFDFSNANNTTLTDTWKNRMVQAHVGVTF